MDYKHDQIPMLMQTPCLSSSSYGRRRQVLPRHVHPGADVCGRLRLRLQVQELEVGVAQAEAGEAQGQAHRDAEGDRESVLIER